VFEDSTFAGTSATVPTSSIGVDGQYTWEVRGVNTCGKGGWSTPQAFQLTVTSVEELNEPGWSITAAPNPLSATSTFIVMSQSAGTVNAALVDMLGRRSSIGTWELSAGRTSLLCNLPSDIASGQYVLLLEQGNQVLCRTAVIVQP
jgi:hypothetical protein